MQRVEEVPRSTFVSGFSLWLSFCSYHILVVRVTALTFFLLAF